MRRPFRQVDVFTTELYRGNPVAVVLGADGLSTSDMQQFASWTNLSDIRFSCVKHGPRPGHGSAARD